MRVGELIDGLDVRPAEPGAVDARICDITEDSRTVLPGSLYIARRGEKADGRDFVASAIRAGAVAVLSDDPALVFPYERGQEAPAVLYAADVELASALMGERFYGNPSSRLALIGVTGTNGKTTTTYLIHQVLNALGIRCGLIGTICVDDGTEIAAAAMTTPPALEISRTLARMLDAGCRAAVLEVSSHSLTQKRVAALSFDVAAFTNLTGDHLDYHRTMAGYAAAKSILFRSLKDSGAAIVNTDDPAWRSMVEGCRARVIGCSIGSARQTSAGTAPPMDASSAEVTGTTAHGTDVRFRGPWAPASIPATLPFVGGYNVMNSLQAVACILALGEASKEKLVALELPAIEAPAVAAAMGRTHLPPGRLECLTSPADPITVYIDYAHTDDALRTVLQVLRAASPAPGSTRPNLLTVVFGCGGDRDATKRPRMGAAASELADKIVITSDNPRTEDPRRIIDEILAGVAPEHRAKVDAEPDREAAILHVIRAARPGEVILIAGKGHEDYQIVPASRPGPGARGAAGNSGRSGATETKPFDDRLIAQRALELRGIRVKPRATLIAPRQQGTPRPRPSPRSLRTATAKPRT